MNIMEKLIKEIKGIRSRKKEIILLKITVSLFDITTEALRISPELRKGFLKVHAKFLDYPEESREIIEKGIEAYKKFVK